MLCAVALVLALAIHNNAAADLRAPAGSCASQEDTLLFFRNGLENGREVLRSWNRSNDLRNWEGVTVGARGKIVKLELPSMDLRGRLNPLWDLLPSIQVMNLSHNTLTGSLSSSSSCGGQASSIQALDLSFNRLNSQLREEIRHLQALKQLHLRSSALFGELPRGLFELRSLEVLDLSVNNFTGSISPDFQLLHRLQHFNLSWNSFSGTFPAANFSRMSALTSIDVSFNTLRSIQPVEIGISSSDSSPFFKQLQILDLSSNNFSGEIPNFAFKISALKLLNLSENAFTGPLIINKAAASIEYLNLAGNHLSGPIPPRLGLFLTNLTVLDLCANEFTGDIPDTIANLQKLQQLKVSNNRLSHMPDVGISLPDSLKVLSAGNNLFSGPLSVSISSSSLLPSKLEVLYLPGNYFSGPIPPELGQLKNLKKLILNQNDFHGEIPASLAGCELLEEIWINNNRLTGQIPVQIFSLKHLRMLVLANNSLSGSPVPQGIARCKTLEVLWLEQNEFLGAIPAEVGQLSSLLMLSLASNNLTGEIPASIGKLNKLVGLDLGSNSISGVIPDELAGLSSIQFLFLSSNLLEQQIPEWIGSLPKLRAVDFSFNRFTGGIPSAWKNSTLTSLSPKYSDKPPSAVVYNNEGQKYIGYALPTTLDFSHNDLTGSIPEQLGVLRNLQILNLSHNKLEGTIPSSLGDVPALLKLDLSSNNLRGSIPPHLSKLSFLSDLNVSFNHLEGEIPQSGQFYTFSNLSFVGNPKLCGLPLQKCSPKLGASESKKIATISLAQKLIPLYIVIAGSIGFCGFWAAFIVLIRRRHKLLSQDEEEDGDEAYGKKKHLNSSEVSTMSEGVAWISPKELMSATGNYTQANIIGDGGFGIVYKATLTDGSVVAVKKLITEGGFGTQGEREFLAEMQTLGKIKHKNLVCLKGYSSDGKDRILVYKYLKNGSLDTWLHCRDEGTKPLDWKTRFRIILGAARGIAFLHHECFPPIVHRDIKASNILLDEDFEAHMADFGLARLMQDAGDTHVSTDVAGTVGYIPPEYNSSCMATMRGDVYSFGVVVLETIMGKRPTDAAFRRAGGIGHLVTGNCSNQELQTVIDPAIVVAPDSEDAEAGSNSASEIVEVMRIACLCCVEKPARRPEMRHVVRMLEAVEARALSVSVASVAAAIAPAAASLVGPPSVEGGSKHFLNNVEI